MGWLEAALRPLGGVTFRTPGPFEAGLHGPATAAASSSYPAPSTLAGLLAGIAWRRGLCAPEELEKAQGAFGDTIMCLRRLGVETLRAGLARKGAVYYAYINHPSCMPRLNSLLDYLSGLKPNFTGRDAALALREAAGRQCSEGLRPAKSEHVGIALDRSSKRVAEGMFYIRERVLYPPEASIVVLTKAGGSLGVQVSATVKLGGDGGLAILSIERSMSPDDFLVKGEGSHWVLTLISPALLQDNPFRESSWPLLTSREASEKLAQALLSRHGCAGHVEIRLIPKGEYLLEVISPGWSTAKSSLREPHLLVPPGTTLYLEAQTHCIKHIVQEGVGDQAEIGWGSVVASALSGRKRDRE